MRFYMRTGPSSGVSVGVVGGLILLLLLAVLWFWLAVGFAVGLLLYGGVKCAAWVWTRKNRPT
jgi:hypothetical protein